MSLEKRQLPRLMAESPLLAAPLLWRALLGVPLAHHLHTQSAWSLRFTRPAQFTPPATFDPPAPATTPPHLPLLTENGPYTINSSLQLVSNPSAWTGFANMIYIDQPINTGLSYSSVGGDGVGNGGGRERRGTQCCPLGVRRGSPHTDHWICCRPTTLTTLRRPTTRRPLSWTSPRR